MSRLRRVSPATLFLLGLSLLLAIALYVKTRPAPPTENPVPAGPGSRAREIAPAPRSSGRSIPRSPESPIPRSPDHPSRESTDSSLSRPLESSAPRIAILIDDLGNDSRAVERIARWPYPVAGAVLPELAGSARTARELERSGKQVLLHLPMEPRGYPDIRPGPGLVLVSQSDEEIRRTLERDLATVPGAVGVNNHMGSAATADERVMRTVAEVLARRGLFFIDSRTTEATVARAAAQEARVPSASRRVFLDDIPGEDAINRSMSELTARARREGEAIAIGHPYPTTLAVLERELPRLQAQGVKLVPLSELVR